MELAGEAQVDLGQRERLAPNALVLGEEVVDAFGQRSLLQFNQFAGNVPLSAEAFVFKLPQVQLSFDGPTIDGLQKPELVAPSIWLAAPLLPGTETAQQAGLYSLLLQTEDARLSAVLADHRNPDGTGWVTLADPEGNEFCVVRSAAERAAIVAFAERAPLLTNERQQELAALLATLSTKATFNDEQRAVILGLGVIQQEPAPAPDPAATPAPAADDFVADMEAAEGAK